ncbi:MAG TPA: hypothetical protein VK766_05320 [Cytophagaceae bacterium]|jgi:hypothetical protein|nr:hypothetical protein [Cytophagaceae bacterium]
MKTNFLVYCLLFFTVSFTPLKAQYIQYVKYVGAFGDEDWTRGWTNYKPNGIAYMPTNITLPNIIDKNTTLSKRNTYLLHAVVYVTNNAVLTIEPGTVIRGDFETCGTLVITKGAKLVANGLETDPIIFTSNKSVGERKPGDWGGIIILGNAEINKLGGVSAIEYGIDSKYALYGGNDDNDNSGSLKYVRIEYPGNKISKDQELNGLTLAGIGKSTIVENVQVSYSNDDSFETFGGTVNLKNIYSYRCTDDDFDFNFGYNGRVQFAVAYRHPLIGDFSGSRCIEADSYSGSKSTMDPSRKISSFSVSNLTLVIADNINTTSSVAFCKEAVYVGKDCNLSLYNSVISGFKTGLFMKDENLKDKAIKNEVKISNNVFNKCEKMFYTDINYDEINTYYTNQSFKNRQVDYLVTDLFKDIFNVNFPDLRLKNKELFDAK